MSLFRERIGIWRRQNNKILGTLLTLLESRVECKKDQIDKKKFQKFIDKSRNQTLRHDFFLSNGSKAASLELFNKHFKNEFGSKDFLVFFWFYGPAFQWLVSTISEMAWKFQKTSTIKTQSNIWLLIKSLSNVFQLLWPFPRNIYHKWSWNSNQRKKIIKNLILSPATLCCFFFVTASTAVSTDSIID